MNSQETEAPQFRRVIAGTLFRSKRRGVRFDTAASPKPEPASRPARVAQMLALAHKIQEAIDRGVVPDRATVARRLGFTRARVTQLLDLTLLAPGIQACVLELEAVDGVEPIAERALRAVARAANWVEQEAASRRLLSTRLDSHRRLLARADSASMPCAHVQQRWSNENEK